MEGLYTQNPSLPDRRPPPPIYSFVTTEDGLFFLLPLILIEACFERRYYGRINDEYNRLH